MAKIKRPTLRYYARFKEDYGYLRAVIRYKERRKYITTPLIIAKGQLDRLDTSGHIIMMNREDIVLENHLKEFTAYIWETVTPLIDSGRFADITSAELSAAILDTFKKKEEERRMRNRAVLDIINKRQQRITYTIEQWLELTKKLRSMLPPEELKRLWEKGGESNGKL